MDKSKWYFFRVNSKDFVAYAVGVMGLAIAVVVGIKWVGHHPAKLMVRPNLPDYSGITVEHIIRQRIKTGKGEQVQTGDTVRVRYEMWVYDPAAPANHGRKLSRDGPQENEITIGESDVINGWEEVLIGMRVGDESNLIIPAYEDYGTQRSLGEAPNGAILQVEMTLLLIINHASQSSSVATPEAAQPAVVHTSKGAKSKAAE